MSYALFSSGTWTAFRDAGADTRSRRHVPMYLSRMAFCLYCRGVWAVRAWGCGAVLVDAILFDRFSLKIGAECAEMFTHRLFGPPSGRLSLSLARIVSKLRAPRRRVWRGGNSTGAGSSEIPMRHSGLAASE